MDCRQGEKEQRDAGIGGRVFKKDRCRMCGCSGDKPVAFGAALGQHRAGKTFQARHFYSANVDRNAGEAMSCKGITTKTGTRR